MAPQRGGTEKLPNADRRTLVRRTHFWLIQVALKMNSAFDRDSKTPRTLYCGNISDAVTEELLYELFLQAGPIEKVTIPKEKDGKQRTFAFIEFVHKVSADYAFKVMRGTELFGRQLQIKYRTNNSFEEPKLNNQNRTKYIYACPMGCQGECPVTGFNGSVTAYLAEIEPMVDEPRSCMLELSSSQPSIDIEEIHCDDTYSDAVSTGSHRNNRVNLIPQMSERLERFNPPLIQQHPQLIGINNLFVHNSMQQQHPNVIWHQHQIQERLALIHTPLFPMRGRFPNQFPF